MKHLKTLLKGLFVALSLCLFTTAFAQEALIKKRLSETVLPGTKITSVKKTPIAGIYEVLVGDKIIYTDSKANYLLLGAHLFESSTQRDLTQERIDQITKIDFSSLPLENAIKSQRGNGSRTIAVFSDPNCGYCKRLEAALMKIDDLTVYTFPLNILSESSVVISKNIWCSENPSKAWTEWMTEGKRPESAPDSCTYDGANVYQFAKKHNISGTPVIVLKNGQRLVGLPPEEDLKAAIAISK